jgi:UDP-2,4-diacetamido-2,4,6-trideoxy-beta-L-altropyranose hydrolase
MRCLTLASELREHGSKVSFISREHHVGLCNLSDAGGFVLIRLPAPDPDMVFEQFPAHAAWLGTSWKEDARQTLAVLDGLAEKPDWLVVDHYAIDQRWESAVAPSVTRLMVIDDLADRPHSCDLLLDQNLVAEFDTRYAGKVPERCRLLLGPKYALLQRDYTELSDSGAAVRGFIRRILIFFGGADQRNLTGRSISAFLALDRPDLEVDVVISAGCPNEHTIFQQTQGHQNIHVHSNLPSLASLMRQADLAIGAGGAASWERLFLGLPAIVVTLADNQRPIAAELHRRQLIRWLGDQNDVDEVDILRALRELLEHGTLQSEFLNGMRVVDGKGVGRVWAAMTVNSSAPMLIRKVTLDDEKILLEWANDPVTRVSAFSRGLITSQTHKKWLQSRLSNEALCRMYIVESPEGEPLGQVRFEFSDAAWVVDYSLSPVFRGRGLGRRLLELALLKLQSEEVDAVVLGQVKVSNLASRRVFESLGFSVLTEDYSIVRYISKINNF